MHCLYLPRQFDSSTETIVSQWLIDEGGQVNSDDSICIIESTGENFELKSSETGVLLKILAKPGYIIRKNDPVAIIGDQGQDVSKIPEQISNLDHSEIEPQTTKSSEDNKMSEKPKEQAVPVLMPQASQSMEEGTILEWKVKEGDTIEVGQVIMEIETDKANMEVEAVNAGRVAKIIAKEGDIVKVKQPVAYLSDNDADLQDTTIQTQSNTKVEKQTEIQQPIPEPVKKETSEPAPISKSSKGSVIPVLMPQASQSMEEGTILEWKVKEGDTIEVGQVIMEIETDKANMEVEAVNAGRVARIIAKEGDVVKVKEPIAYLADNNADIDSYLGTKTSKTEDAPEPSTETIPSEVETAKVSATAGPKSLPMTKMRKAIAKNLSYSKQNIPHFYAKTTVDAAEFFALYRKTKEHFKCTVNDFVTLACAKTINQYPVFRCQYRDNEILEFPSVNIGIAVGTEEGLTVPVVLNADKLTLKELAANSRQLIENARNGKCENVGQGIFTITNLGMLGIEEFTAIINPPEAALLSVGAIRDGVTVVDGQMKVSKLMTMVLSLDHRIIDGVMGAQFMQTMKEILEDPQQLVD